MELSDKYETEKGSVYLTGIQALVRLPMDAMRRDRRAGLKTAAFISGYEGSPLGGYDLALLRSRRLLDPLDIHFQPGVNEDLAATSVMGSQIIETLGKARVDGVVGIWYGKGPGVDRSGDIFRHANLAGASNHGGALLLAGDDHISKSSTIPHQSDFSLYNVGIPFFFPGNTQEVLDYGLMAIALSRFSGAWVGMKMVTDVCDGGGTITVDPECPRVRLPEGYRKYTDARIVAPISLALEHEVVVRRLDAAREFARLNRVNVMRGPAEARIGLLSAGKAFYDMVQALRDLGIDESGCAARGIRIGKVAMPFPLDPEFVRQFASGLEKIIVVEEKRSFLEMQLREILYDSSNRPMIFGKSHLPATGELNPDLIGQAIAAVAGVPVPASRQRAVATPGTVSKDIVMPRPAAFCSGCPHNRSTLLLEGQVAGGGIGCHTMAMRLMDPRRQFSFLTHMGGEGAPWIGMSPFTERSHIFQNIGDGTLFHSGYLAIEACVAAGVNITYKILYNGHVAMTGGQHAVGALPIPALTKKLQAEGVKRTVVLAEDVERYQRMDPLASNAELRDRRELEPTLKEMEGIEGVTVIVYDQECAAEKRRARSRGKMAEPVKRLVIHEEVCEGCGDCVKQANCMSLVPVDTPRGQKMRIHQSSCNKDYSCALGDCPSFVTVTLKPGTGLKKRQLPDLPAAETPAPRHMVSAAGGYRIIAPGIGGTGVVTVSALLATAAWLDGLSVTTLDQTGTAQKGGAVVSHLLLSDAPIEAPAKVNSGNADLLLGFDLLGVAAAENLKTANPDKTIAVVNSDVAPTIDTIRNRIPISGPGRLVDVVNASTVRGRNLFVDANRLAEALFGTHMAANLFLTGVAYQAGLIPISIGSIERAIELNGVEASQNHRVFAWGRKYYEDAAWVESRVSPKPAHAEAAFDRVAELRAYQNDAYARRYSLFLDRIEDPRLREVAAKSMYKLMAYKDEYEVARLLTRPQFETRAREMWEAVESLSYNLHPPFLRRFGVSRKLTLGPWFRSPLKLLAALRVLRGTPLDLFGYSGHRKIEKSLIGWYEELIRETQTLLSAESLPLALEIAALPDQIRGYESIKEQSIVKVKALAQEKLKALSTPRTERQSAAPV